MTTKKEARYLSDKATLETTKGAPLNDDGTYKLNIDFNDASFKILRILPENYLKFAREKNEEIKKEVKKKEQIFVEEFLITSYKANGEIKSEKLNINGFVRYLIKKYSFKTIFGSKSEEIFVYKDGVYVKNGRAIIQTETEKILGSYSTNHNVREIQEKIKRLFAIDKEKFDEIPVDLICLNNGILNLKTRKLESHNPKYYFKRKFNITFDKTEDCKEIRKFLKETFYPEDIKFVQEWFGFNLYRVYFIKKAVICFGERDTGKTIFLSLLKEFINRKNTAGISLQRIASGDKFALASLKDKYSNIFDDLSSKDLADQGGFKIATGGGYITAEHKFGDPFQFLNFAKHTFATNKIPPVEDVDDEAYYDRWIPLAFDNQVEKKEQDKFLINKLITEKEMSGLLNYALEGLKRLFKNGEFSYNKKCDEIKRIMERYSDPLSAFAQAWLIEKPGNQITKEQMFQIYSVYCNQNKTVKMTKEQLGRKLGKKITYVVDKRGKERFWENIDINKLHINKDTLDTLQQTICGNIKSKSNKMYKIFQEVSKVSKKKQEKLIKIQEKLLSKKINPKQAEELIKKCT